MGSSPGLGVEVGSSTPGLEGEADLDSSLVLATDLGEGGRDWRCSGTSSRDISEAAELEVAGGIRAMGNLPGLKSQGSSEPLSL